MRPFARAQREQDTGEAQTMRAEPELDAERDRLNERFALMQAELGGLFYEMAIRDHINMDLLIERAAAIQRLESELVHVAHLRHGGDAVIGGRCERCAAPYARGAGFCSECGDPVG
jgi:hypothetical protein